MATARIKPHGGIHLDLTLPGDKSISHRAAMIAALATGESKLKNFTTGADGLSTLSCLQQLGIEIQKHSDSVTLAGNGLRGLKKPGAPLNCGNSGTTARLLAGILAGQNFDSTLCGDASLSSRPMKRVLEPLQQMGAHLSSSDGKLPIQISGRRLKPIDYTLPVPSAQVKSCLLFAGLFADGKTTVRENIPSRDHTERMLSGVLTVKHKGATHLSVIGGQEITAHDRTIPGDISSAAFLLAAGLLVPDSEIRIRRVGLNPTRTGFLNVLHRMGARLEVEVSSEDSLEPFGNVRVRSHREPFQSISLNGPMIPNLIDEIPILAVLGTRCENGMEVRDAGELRKKECDRIEAVVNNLRAMNISVDEFEDGFFIHPSPLRAASLPSYGDHRIAMAFAVAGLAAEAATRIHDAECIAISFPEFFGYLEIETDEFESVAN
jgi:3-phosphoshikimate 1-carboxyvinyltransferase